MKVFTIDGKDYRLPGSLNAFQQEMYVHLINWKWNHITKEPGHYQYKGESIPYDAILPKAMVNDLCVVFQPLRNELQQHKKKFPFRQHIHFNHMASSQAANVNLFLPVLLHSNVDEILGAIKPDFKRLTKDRLYKGFCIEFWDTWNDPLGNLGDKTAWSGTDSDIAVAYENYHGENCLWLIEHKLTEAEFTTCGGFKSKNRQGKHDCTKSFAEILKDKNSCYYHDVRKFHYWDITAVNQGFFTTGDQHNTCPFKGGMNQLWRNQLLCLSIEQDPRQLYKHVFFSVVKHSGNTSLDNTIAAYKNLIGNNAKFSVFTSADVIAAAEQSADEKLRQWITMYKEVYRL